MTTKWGRFQGALDRLHQDFEFPTATFSNWTTTGITSGQPDGSYSDIGTIDVEFVPPAVDSTVDTEGTHLGFSTSIRVPQNDLVELSASIVDYGEDNERPTRVSVENELYEIQAQVPEHGSDMYLLRLTEV